MAVKPNSITILMHFTAQYSNTLVQVRRSVNGLRMNHIYPIIYLGEHSEGLRICQLAKILGRHKNTASNALKRCVAAGWMVRSGLSYQLSSNGWLVYNTILKETAKTRKVLIQSLAAEVIKNKLD